MTIEELTQKPAAEILRDTDRNSVGVVRILASSAGRPGEEREYELGDEALVEAGHAEWVLAPVHLPAAGRRLDTDAEREPAPLGGVETYPPAEPTTGARRAEARQRGSVEAHVDRGVGERLTAKRAELARETGGSDDDARRQAELGGLGARSGPVTAVSDLEADQPPPVDQGEADRPVGDTGRASTPARADVKSEGPKK